MISSTIYDDISDITSMNSNNKDDNISDLNNNDIMISDKRNTEQTIQNSVIFENEVNPRLESSQVMEESLSHEFISSDNSNQSDINYSLSTELDPVSNNGTYYGKPFLVLYA